MADVGRFLARLFGTEKLASGPKAKSLLEMDLLEGRAVPSATVTQVAVDPSLVQSDSAAIIRVADPGATTQTGAVVVAQSGQTDTDPTVVSLAPPTQMSGSSQTMVVNNSLGQLPGPIALQSGQSGQTITDPIMVSGQSGQTTTGPVAVTGQSGQTVADPIVVSGQSGQTLTGPVLQSGHFPVDPIVVHHHHHDMTGPIVVAQSGQADTGPIALQSGQSGQTVQSAS